MIVRTRRLSLAALTTVVALGLTAPVEAQQLSSSSNAQADAVRSQPVPAGPTIERAATGARPLSHSDASLDAADAAMQQRLGLGQARALMIVGFAAVVIGLLMDNEPGTLIAVGGAVVGLYGLYHYLR
jgi:hypothetical protein